MKQKKILLEKNALMKLQDEQMKAMIGGEEDKQTNDSGVACGNTVQAAFAAVEDSCCRRSCSK